MSLDEVVKTGVGGELLPIDAPTAYRFFYNDEVLASVRALYERMVAPALGDVVETVARQGTARVQAGGHAFCVKAYGPSLFWLSCDNLATHALFQAAFDRLNVAAGLKGVVAHDERIVMYCGFFIVSFEMQQAVWHVDYAPGANAFTLLTPLFDLDFDHGHLLYLDLAGRVSRHLYRRGEGLLVGEGILHTTEPYARTVRPRVLFSVTAGTDRMAHWPRLQQTIGHQSDFLLLPCGHAQGSCRCSVEHA